MTTLKNHTPGPWEIDHDCIVARGIVPNGIVCDVRTWPDKQAAGQNQANARLIAAAPELLEALLKIKAICEPFLHNKNFATQHEIFVIADKAGRSIAKAEGRTE